MTGYNFSQRAWVLGCAIFSSAILMVGCVQQQASNPVDNGLRLNAAQSDFADTSKLGHANTDEAQRASKVNKGVDTKATEVSFQNGDAIGLFIHTAPTAIGGNHSTNIKYATHDMGSSWSAYAPLSSKLQVGTSYFSTAYYPYNSNHTNPTDIDHSVKLDQSAAAGESAANLELSDFMITVPTAINVKSDASVVDLRFKHLLTKLYISVGIPAVVDNLTVTGVKSVKVKGLQTGCSINLVSGVVTPKSGTVAEITPRLARGTGKPGETSYWEAIVVPQSVAAATPMVEFICTLSDGSEYPLTYTVPAASALVLNSGSRLNMMLGASSNPSFLTAVSFDTGEAAADVPIQIKVMMGLAWKLNSAAPWLTVASSAGGAYGDELTGVGTGSEHTVYVKITENSGPLALPREGMLTLSDSEGASITYLAFQNYSFFNPTFNVWNLSAGAGQSRAIDAFMTNRVWSADVAGTGAAPLTMTLSATANGAPLLLPYKTTGSLTTNAMFMQVAEANNSNDNRTGKVIVEVVASPIIGTLPAPRRFAELAVTQNPPVLGLSAASQNVAANATSATFNVTTSSNQFGVTYTAAAGANATSVEPAGLQAISSASTSHTQSVTVNFPENSYPNPVRNIVATVTTSSGSVLTHTIKQEKAAPPTVTIAGTKWTLANLTGTASSNTDHKVEANPQDKGMFYKWGATYNYMRASSSSEGEGFVNGQYTRGASTNGTVTGNVGYDYVNLTGSAYSGDPCKKLGTNYRTPTRAQWKALHASGKSGWTTYQGMQGYFFGPKAAQCNNTTIQEGCIFLPASGYRFCGSGSLDFEGSYGLYWSSSVSDANYGYFLYFHSSYIFPEHADARSYGFSVRCVQE